MARPTRAPRHLKLLSGTLKPYRDQGPEKDGLPTIDEPPEAPAWLTHITAIAEWRRLSTVMAANKLLTEGNVGLLAHLCMLHARLVDLWTSSEKPNAALIAAYRTAAGDLSLTHMKLPSGETNKNRFAQNGKRKA